MQLIYIPRNRDELMTPSETKSPISHLVDYLPSSSEGMKNIIHLDRE